MEKYNDEEKVQLMLRKGVYCNDYFSDLSKYNETQLPPAKDFYDSLGNTDVNPKDYEHAQKVWTELGVQDLREYTDLYNISDVLLLLDCFNKLRSVLERNFLKKVWTESWTLLFTSSTYMGMCIKVYKGKIRLH